MTRAKLAKLKRELLQLRRSPQKAAVMESFAKSLGRKKFKRGKEPTWESETFPLFPVSIPHHGSKDLTPGVRDNILDALEEDIFAWEEHFDDDQEDDESDDQS